MYVRNKVMDEFHQVIVPNQMEAKEKMRGIHNAQTKAHVEEKIKGSIAGYERIENQIKTLDPKIVNWRYKDKMLNELTAHKDELKRVAKSIESIELDMKENVLKKLREIKWEMIAQNVKSLENFLHFIKWNKKIPHLYVEQKYQALGVLIKHLEDDKEPNKKLVIMNKIDDKIQEVRMAQTAKKKKLAQSVMTFLGEKGTVDEDKITHITGMISSYTDNICELEKAANIFAPIENAAVREEIQAKFKEESKTLCDQRKSDNLVDKLKFDLVAERAERKGLELENALNIGDAELFNEKIAKYSEEQKEKFRIRKSRQIKYPVAKAMLHLMAAYLCENVSSGGKSGESGVGNSNGNGQEEEKEDKCGTEHKELALKELKPLGVKIDDLVDRVKRMVFFTIGDFIENFVIREEIVKQYGQPLKKHIEVMLAKEENEEKHNAKDDENDEKPIET